MIPICPSGNSEIWLSNWSRVQPSMPGKQSCCKASTLSLSEEHNGRSTRLFSNADRSSLPLDLCFKITIPLMQMKDQRAEAPALRVKLLRPSIHSATGHGSVIKIAPILDRLASGMCQERSFELYSYG